MIYDPIHLNWSCRKFSTSVFLVNSPQLEKPQKSRRPLIKKDRVGIICSIETVAVFRNRSRRQDPLKLRLSDPVLFFGKDRGNILGFYPTNS